MPEPERYTEAEWRNREMVQACANGGHQATTYVRAANAVPMLAYCECGRYRYTPEQVAKPSDVPRRP